MTPLLGGGVGGGRLLRRYESGTLEDLGTMLTLWRGDWAGNTVTLSGGLNRIETWQNTINVGTLDLDQSTAAARSLYNATGWGGTNATGQWDSTGNWYRVDGLAAYFTGEDKPITIISATEFLGATGYFDATFSLGNSSDGRLGRFELDFDNTGKWRTIRGDTLGTFKNAIDAAPSGREIRVVTLAGGTALTTWRNGVKVSDAVDLDVAAQTFDSAAVGGYPSGAGVTDGIFDAHIGLLGVYSTAFTDAQAAAAYSLIYADYPNS